MNQDKRSLCGSSFRIFVVLFFKTMVAAAAAAKSHQLCPTLRDPIDGSSLGSPVPGILLARTLEWVATYPTICDSMDCSLLGSSVHGIFQTRILEWVAISFSGVFSLLGTEPGSPAVQTDSLPTELLGKPDLYTHTHIHMCVHVYIYSTNKMCRSIT